MVGSRVDRGGANRVGRVTGGDPPPAAWSVASLRRPTTALAVVATAFAIGALAVIVSCNAHEIGHAAVGTALGWEVDRIILCLPGGGEVRYRSSSPRGDAIEAWSGGIVGALALATAYTGLVARRSGPLRNPLLWAAGLGLSLPIGPQIVIAALEGTSGSDDYRETIAGAPALWGGVLALAATAGPTAHGWIWRQAFRRERAA